MSERADLIVLARQVREQYLPPEKWSCRVCGSPMTFAASGRDGTKYACTRGYKEMFDKSIPIGENIEHNRMAERWVTTAPDSNVVRVCDALLARPTPASPEEPQ